MALFLLLAAAVAASPVAEDAAVVPAVVDGADRDAKLFSVFQIIKFNNDACDALDGSVGSCYTGAECTALGGTDGGKCAAGFGVCCISVIDPNCAAGTVSKLNSTRIVNPGYPGKLDTTATCSPDAGGGTGGRIFFPAATADTSTAVSEQITDPSTVTPENPKEYVYKIAKMSADVVQMRIDFIAFDIGEPVNGMCSNESLSISKGLDAVTMKVLPDKLCGVLTGSHVYLSVKDLGVGADDYLEISISVTTDGEQQWVMVVSQFESDQTAWLAPYGCLQFYREDAATLTSFNYNGGNGGMIDNLGYSICLGIVEGLCDVALTAVGDFDMDANADGSCKDAITFGATPFCGQTFANAGSLAWNFTGPYSVSVFTDGDGTSNNMGFNINYIMLPC